MPDDDYNCERMVKFIRHCADALEIDRAVVCGNSWGGLLAWLFAVRYEERVSRLVLIDSVGFPFEDPFMWRLAQKQPFETILRYVTPRFLVRSELLSAVYDPASISEEQITLYYELLRREGNRRAQILQNKQPFAFRATASALAQMKSIRVPTLIMWGANDPWLSPSVAYQFEKEITHARVIVYPRTGHIPMEEHPEQTAADLRYFLAEEAPATEGNSASGASKSGRAHF
jgi:pimeloyl-ACP methyl ester carboxylesterase